MIRDAEGFARQALKLGETVPMENRQPAFDPVGQEASVTQLLDQLLDGIDPGVLSQRSLDDLRDLRHRYQEIETGLSFGRRLVQGRLDIVLAELQRRSEGHPATGAERVGDLPDVLAQHTRGAGPARIVPETDLPDFVDVFGRELDDILCAEDLVRLQELDAATIGQAVDSLEAFERQLSLKRHELHRAIDEVQEEIIGRYRSGSASVDDLLR
jgi:hypothetical protein